MKSLINSGDANFMATTVSSIPILRTDIILGAPFGEGFDHQKRMYKFRLLPILQCKVLSTILKASIIDISIESNEQAYRYLARSFDTHEK